MDFAKFISGDALKFMQVGPEVTFLHHLHGLIGILWWLCVNHVWTLTQCFQQLGV